MLDFFRGGRLRQLLRSVVGHPDFKPVRKDKDVVDRYHQVSQFLLSRDPETEPTGFNTDPLESLYHGVDQDDKSKFGYI